MAHEPPHREYTPGLRLRGLRFTGEDEIELDFEGLGTSDRVFYARREHIQDALWVINFDEDFGRLYRGIPLLWAGETLEHLVSQAWASRREQLPSDSEWERLFAEGKERLRLAWEAEPKGE